MTWAEYQALLQGLSGDPIVAGSQNFYIPLWIALVRSDSGQSPHDEFFFLQQIVDEINTYFNNGMIFYVCGITYVDKTAWQSLQVQTPPSGLSEKDSLTTLIKNLHPQEYEDGFINLHIVNGFQDISGTAIAGMPGTVAHGTVISSILDGRTIAHELGHYFGLSHTFIYGPTPDDPVNLPQWAQYVDSLVTLNGIVYDCSQTGDFICDTPADPGTAYCGSGGCISDSCTISDPLDKDYHPDKTLLMSYYGNCRYRFSSAQNQRMIDFYTMHQNWAFLLAPLPDCQELPSDIGLIRRDCQNITGAAGISPIANVQVTLEDATSQICGNPFLTTDALGRYLTHYCVLPSYSGSGLLSILPDKGHSTADAGISTLDLALISKHILGITPFENPFQIIAADENNSGSVTSFDILEIRKMLLGIKDTLAAGSWRYVPDYCFADSAFAAEFSDDDDPNTAGLQLNPFNAVWTNPDETGGQSRTYSAGLPITIPNTSAWMDHVSIDPENAAAQQPRPWSFWAVKTGDVNCSASIDQSLPPDEPFVPASHAAISTNQVFTLQIRVFEDTPVTAWQLGIDFAEDSLEILEVLAGNSGEGFSQDNFGLTEIAQGKLRALNFSETGATTDLDNKILFKVRVKALQPISNLSQRFRVKNSVLPKIFYAGDGTEIEEPTLQLEVVSGLSMPGIPGGGSHPSASNAADAYQLSVYPLPFRDLVRFDFDLAADAEVRLALYDSRGCLVTGLQEIRAAGPNTLTLEALGGQPAGFYFYIFEAGKGRQFGKLAKN